MGVMRRETRAAWHAVLWLNALASLLSVRVAHAQSAAASVPWHVSVSPAMLRLGVDRAARVEIHGPDVPANALDIVTSVGTIHALVRIAAGTFVARYEPPASRAPDIALIVVRSANASVPGVAALSLAGRYHLTIEVEPFAHVRVELADGVVHDAVAPGSGTLDLTLHVPPGVERARIAATDRSGNRSDRFEPLAVPPLHRMLMLRARESDQTLRRVRWFVVQSLPDGTLNESNPESIEVSGARGVVTRRASGVFEVVAEPPRRAIASTMSLRVHANNIALDPDHEDVAVPANVPVRLRWASAEAVRAGLPMELQLWVEDADGVPVAGVADSITVHLPERAPHVQASGDGYAVITTAPERVGPHEIYARFALAPDLPLEARTVIQVTAGSPERLVVQAPPLVVGTVRDVTLTALDRFGNPSRLGQPTVIATGAVIRRAQNLATGLVVTLEPTDTAVRIAVRGDYGFADRASLIALQPAMRHLNISLLGILRSNLHAANFGGTRLSISGQFLLAPQWEGIGLFDTGVEGTSIGASSATTATVLIVPLLARIGVLRRLATWRIGVIAGGGFRITTAWIRTRIGETLSQQQWVPTASAGVLVRWHLPAGAFTGEVGGESGWLDTVPVRGTLGGVYATFGWGLTF